MQHVHPALPTRSLRFLSRIYQPNLNLNQRMLGKHPFPNILTAAMLLRARGRM